MSHHLQSLGWTLVNFCWLAAAIAFVYWLADAALSRRAAKPAMCWRWPPCS